MLFYDVDHFIASLRMPESQLEECEVAKIMIMFLEYLWLNIFGMRMDGSSYFLLQGFDGVPMFWFYERDGCKVCKEWPLCEDVFVFEGNHFSLIFFY